MRLLGGNSFWKAGHFWYPAVRFQGVYSAICKWKARSLETHRKAPMICQKVSERSMTFEIRIWRALQAWTAQCIFSRCSWDFSIRAWYKDILYLDDPLFGWSSHQLALNYVQEISYVGPCLRGPQQKLEYLYSSSCNLLRGPLVRSYLSFDGPWWS